MGRRIYPDEMPRTPEALNILSRIIRVAEAILERHGKHREHRGRRGGLLFISTQFQSDHFFIWGRRLKSRWDLAIRERRDNDGGVLDDGVYIDSPADEHGNSLPRPMIDLEAAKRALKELEPLVVLDILAGIDHG